MCICSPTYKVEFHASPVSQTSKATFAQMGDHEDEANTKPVRLNHLELGEPVLTRTVPASLGKTYVKVAYLAILPSH